MSTTSSTPHAHSVTVGTATITFPQIHGYQDVSVIEAVWAVIGKPHGDMFYTSWQPHVLHARDASLSLKIRTLAPFGTRLLIRVAKRLYEKICEDQEYFSEETHALLLFVNPVLKLRARKTSHMRAFIEHEYNPDHKRFTLSATI